MLYKIKFFRINTGTDPMLRQETDVVFRSDLEVDNFRDYRDCLEIIDADEFGSIMWKEMWKQNQSWFLSHGPSTINFPGWSSVLLEYKSLVKVILKDQDEIDDLTGEGNMLTALTFHPLLPNDLQQYLQKAYDRGVKDTKNKV